MIKNVNNKSVMATRGNKIYLAEEDNNKTFKNAN